MSYKNKKQIERPESEWLKFENTHEPLISQELWDIVQDVRRHKKRPPQKMDTPNLFSGMVYCADCGGTMVLHRAHTMKETQNNFMCSTYRKRGKEECSAHYIREVQLKAIILDDLKRVTHYARQKEKLFVEHITRKNTVETRNEINRIQREIDAVKRRDRELTALFKRLYEDNVLGRIPNEHFRLLSSEYTTEQEICIYYRDIGLMDKPGEYSKMQGYDEVEELEPGSENETDDSRSPAAATDTDPAA